MERASLEAYPTTRHYFLTSLHVLHPVRKKTTPIVTNRPDSIVMEIEDTCLTFVPPDRKKIKGIIYNKTDWNRFEVDMI